VTRQTEIEREQAVLTGLYDRLDELRDATRGRLTEVRRRGASGTPQARSERDAFAALYEDRITALDAVESGLCFGRLDRTSGESMHVGRIGLSDEQHEAMLVDWRAPAASAFYQATPAEPMGVSRRRQLRTRGRVVLDVEDDVFDVEGLSAADRETLGGGGALLAAVSAVRTGRMRDIVATIQGEQDRVIRDDPGGTLVVQGGPGTGKTAVALHRAAYLLYTERERLSRSGVLVVGPGATFLRYIEQVLPALGETGVVTSTLAGLLGEPLPGNGRRGLDRDSDEVAAVKAHARMAGVIARAVALHERVPDGPVVIPFDEHELVLTPNDVAGARSRARRGRQRHNRARYAFARQLLRLLVGRLGEIDQELAAAGWVARSLMAGDEFRDLVNQLWPRLSPAELVASLLTDPAVLDRAGRDLSREQRRLLLRAADAAWTEADVPLVDEAWALLGDPDEMVQVAADRRRARADRAYAEQVLQSTGTAGRIDADTLAARFADPGRGRSPADRAAAEPDWEFGHVIVDEAQELSPMAWRMIARRCPNRSMTVVGDIAQASSSWAPRAWGEVLDDISPGRWRLRELTVNYRTPDEVMTVAAAVLAAVDPGLDAPASVRSTGLPPEAVPAGERRLEEVVAEVARRFALEGGDGRMAVVVPDDLLSAVAAATVDALPRAAAGGAEALDARVAVLDVMSAKGLEFDDVVVVEPARWVAAGSRGLRDLYVALTRATQRVTIVHADPLPDVLAAGLDRARRAA
jgi:DNA helicase IV